MPFQERSRLHSDLPKSNHPSLLRKIQKRETTVITELQLSCYQDDFVIVMLPLIPIAVKTSTPLQAPCMQWNKQINYKLLQNKQDWQNIIFEL